MVKRNNNNKDDNAKRNIENYEKNLSTQYDNLRKCVDIQITSMLPEQDRTIKTYLWFNIAMIGAIFSIILKYYETIFVLPIIFQILIFSVFMLFLFSSLLSIAYCLLSIPKTGEVAYGDFKDKNIMCDIEYNEYTRVTGLLKAIDCLRAAFDFNVINIQKKAVMMKTASNSIKIAFLSFIVFSIYFFAVVHVNLLTRGGDYMVNEKTENAKPTLQTVSSESSTSNKTTVQMTKSADTVKISNNKTVPPKSTTNTKK
jgi:hypothetical protein